MAFSYKLNTTLATFAELGGAVFNPAYPVLSNASTLSEALAFPENITSTSPIKKAELRFTSAPAAPATCIRVEGTSSFGSIWLNTGSSWQLSAFPPPGFHPTTARVIIYNSGTLSMTAQTWTVNGAVIATTGNLFRNLTLSAMSIQWYLKSVYSGDLSFGSGPSFFFDSITIDGNYTIWSSLVTIDTDDDRKQVVIADGSSGLADVVSFQFINSDATDSETAAIAAFPARTASSISLNWSFSFTGIVYINAILSDGSSVYLGSFSAGDFTVGGGFVLSGSATTLLLQNISGIYSLVPDQRHDILYDRTTTPVTTINVEIPDPYGITAYIPGFKK